jgi:hypothetical protein
LYSRTAIDSADDYILELTDYAYRKLLNLLSKEKSKAIAPSVKDMLEQTPIQDLDR